MEKYIEWGRRYSHNLANKFAFYIYDQSYVSTAYLSYATVILIAVILVSLGSYSTIERPRNAKIANDKHPLFDPSDRDETSIPEAVIDETHAFAMPVLAGIALIGLYFAIRNWDIEKITRILNCYLIILSVKANSFTISYLIKVTVRKICHQFGFDSLRFVKRYAITISRDDLFHSAGVEENFLLPDSTEAEEIIKSEMLLESRVDIKKENQLFNFYCSTADIYGWFFGIAFSIVFALLDGKNNWILSNIFGASFTIFGLSVSRLPSFRPALILLILFFVYDIYFVFGSDVMVDVATKIDIPVKMLVPSKLSSEHNEVQMSILGLGDMIVPGLFISLCLRYDLYRYHELHPCTEFHHLQKIDKPYFYSALIGYTIGLISTVTVLHVFNRAQPALLYLCPSIILSTISTALYRGELKGLWEYNEEERTTAFEQPIDFFCSPETLLLAGPLISSDDEEEDHDYSPETFSDSDF
ncbi:hypothetical protein KL918_000261 [Ogataea parapolymorpha]|uniref:Signal peptide peptidase n=1 Tax=Ogataea parapolymorpha (strain ATCC 26012 / BCRC 20466 / JCM 22074 / NRRL Y-7560 / DL-1) TaxID=871575 RepID=W1Q7I5_OGAPD|nr:hypothetical protein HPODL_02935 [Ogataea parapolymorpha DL-1]ESW96309.1 hypothetical protein HPODL_02935 [Ogataea parapolymorpha DL-1]KAG7870057.1 hypothetical protein KL918_000261 [Ogataea parapolymorpha]KAG7875006.1 hypothetical protein KL916_000618 [Ogataea parapolymorpha]